MSNPPKFIIGVEQQPVDSFDVWKLLGVNTLATIPQGHDPVAWVKAANAAGLYQIRAPVGDPAVDAGNPLLLAWAFPDEPDLKQLGLAQLAAMRDATAAAAAVRPVPWFINFDGSRVLNLQPSNPPVVSPAQYLAYGGLADWIGHDVYPVTGWGGAIDFWSPLKAMRTLRGWFPTKPQLMYVECSDQCLPWVKDHRGPDPGEMRLAVQEATYMGCRGVIYFPEQIGGFKFDAMSADERGAMLEINRRLAEQFNT